MKNPLKRKLYYSISEVAEITKLQPYTLRAWEKEFSCLRPRRIRGKNRSYRARDIGIVLLIKRLLYDERYTTQGASQKLKNEPELVRNAAANTAFSAQEKQREYPVGFEEETTADSTLRSGGQASRLSTAVEKGLEEVGVGAEDRAEMEALNELKRLLDGTRKELNKVLQILG